jgi:short-subunit dehydrogenase
MVEEVKISTGQKPLAVVTGATGGIGYELAKQFAEHGFDLLITGRSEGIFIAAESLAKLGGRVEALQADLARTEEVERLYEWIKAHGPVEALALNAGVGLGGDFLRSTTLEENLNLIALNVTSVVHLAKRVGEDMVLAKRGKILITASVAAVIPVPYLATYAASKAFVHMFAISLRGELWGTGVTVTSLLPGPTETDWFRRAKLEGTRLGRAKRDDPVQVARQGFEGLMAGRAYVIAGSLLNRVQARLAKYGPLDVVLWMGRYFGRPDAPR